MKPVLLVAFALVFVGCHDIVQPNLDAQIDSMDLRGDQNRVLLKSGNVVNARLVVGADGAVSRVRKILGIRQDHYAYNQHGLVAVVGKQKANPGVAWQRFLSGGPALFSDTRDLYLYGRARHVWAHRGGVLALRIFVLCS